MDAKQAHLQIIEALKYLRRDSLESKEIINWLYTPVPELSLYLDRLKQFLSKEKASRSERQAAGYLLEEILLLTFKGVAGFSEVKSYQSASHQYDLLVSGDGTEWDILCRQLYLNQHQRGIIVEAKAIGKAVSSAQFSRLCSIMSLDLCDTVGLGIFFTLESASGFPKRSESRTSCVRHARLCQALFHAKTGRKIIVIDKDDILELDQNGSFITLLIRKIREIEELSGLPTARVSEPVNIDLPSHLEKLIKRK